MIATTPHLQKQLRQACADGIDVNHENVGGAVFEAVFPLLNTSARIPTLRVTFTVYQHRLTGGSQSAASTDGGERFPEFMEQMSHWRMQKKIHYREQLVDGLENVPQGVVDLLDGRNFGKVVIRSGEHER